MKFEKESSQPLSRKDKMTLWKSAAKTLAYVHRHTRGHKLNEVLSESDRKEYGASPGVLNFWKWRVSVYHYR